MNADSKQPESSKVVLDQTADGKVTVDVLFARESFWLTQKLTGELFQVGVNTVNYHLKVLRAAGLVSSERRGQWVYHRVNQRAVLGAVRDLTEVS